MHFLLGDYNQIAVSEELANKIAVENQKMKINSIVSNRYLDSYTKQNSFEIY